MFAADRDFEAVASAFAASVTGGGLDPAVEDLIARAGCLRDQPAQALPLLEQARALAPRHPVPVIALYRFHFYGHQLAQARTLGEDALAIARQALGPDFGDQPLDDERARHDAAARFYLFTLKGLAYLSLRLGDWEEARSLLAELRRLDPQDRVGGALLAHVLGRHEALAGPDGAALLAEGPVDYPVRGWGPAG